MSYTVTWNALNCATVILPVSNAQPEIDAKQPREKFFSPKDEFIYNLCMYNRNSPRLALMPICHAIDEPEKWRNAPISLQLVAGPYEEEAVIRMAEIIDDAVKSSKGN